MDGVQGWASLKEEFAEMEQGATAGQPKYKISSIFNKHFFFFNFLFYIGV